MTYYITSTGIIPNSFILDFSDLIKNSIKTTYHKGNNTENFCEVIGSFDVETSTLKVNNNDRNIVYIWSLSFIDFKNKENLNRTNIVENSICLIGRTMEDFNSVLREVSDICSGFNIVIYIQNLNYELDRILINCPYARDTLKYDKSIILATHLPLSITCGNIIFKDSLKLFNAGLGLVGKQYNYPKLDYEYESIRLPQSTLTNKDYEYNMNDVYIVLYAIIRICVNNHIDSVTKIPLTSTGLTRYLNEHTKEINPQIGSYERLRKRTNGNIRRDKKIITLMDDYRQSVRDNAIADEDIPFFESLFSGGYSHGNIYGISKVFENVLSCDFHSAYPGMMVSCKFPYNIKKYDKDDKLKTLLYLQQKNVDYLNGVTPFNIIVNHMKPCKTWFACSVTIDVLKVKQFKVDNLSWCAPIISISKCLNEKTEICRFNVDNGRLLAGENVKLNITSLDLLNIIMCYEDFNIIECSELFIALKQAPMHDFKLNAVKKWYSDKDGLKLLKNWCDNPVRKLTKQDFINEKYKLIDENAVEEFIELSKNDFNTFKDTINDMYMKSKNSLNGQYGIMVMHIIRENVMVSVLPVGYDYIKEGTTITKQKESYQHGLCITAYTRLHLIAFTMFLASKVKILPLYWDTDSVKLAILKTTRTEIHNVVEEYNTYVKKVRPDLPEKIGMMDDSDGFYQYFKYLGSKRYIYLENDKIHITVAGLPKKQAEKYFTELYNRLGNNFYDLCDYFRPNVFIHQDITDKLVPEYFNLENDDLEVTGLFTDDFGEQSYINEWSGFLLRKVPFALVDLTKTENRAFYQTVAKIQKKDYQPDVEYPPIIINRDKDTGKLTIKKGKLNVPDVLIYLRGTTPINEVML